jgi:hypothetical protein
LEAVDKSVCRIMDTRDIRFIDEVLARLRFGDDLARLQASYNYLKGAVTELKLAETFADQIRVQFEETELAAHFCDILSRQRKAFQLTDLYRITLPYMLTYYDACQDAWFAVAEAPDTRIDSNAGVGVLVGFGDEAGGDIR